MAIALVTVASRDLVAGKGPNAHLDVDQDHFQFKRDLNSYRYHFPGDEAPSHDYNEVRDRFVRFLTSQNNATFAEASEAVKKRVGVLMSLANQYTVTLGHGAVASYLAVPGGNPMSFQPVANNNVAGTDMQFAKNSEGNITLTITERMDIHTLLFNKDNTKFELQKLPAGSTYAFNMTITLPKENLDELAEADWAHYDREEVNNFEVPMDDRVEQIPLACRFKGTVDLVFHLHEADAHA